ncbi:MAG: hypothetical protein QOH90_790 [Actinomycetota bacterium]|nr:hypothetical protein [Actinomycetota bacterium]
MAMTLRTLTETMVAVVRRLDAAAAGGSISNAKAATYATSRQVALRTYALTDGVQDPFKKTA